MIRISILLLTFVYISKASEEMQETCIVDDDCRHTSTCQNELWVHKDLFPMSQWDLTGTILLFFIAALANASGIGGGALNVLLLISTFMFQAHFAVALSQAINLGGSFMAMCLKCNKRHPYQDRPLVDFRMVLTLQGPCLLGTSFGVVLHQMAPEWLILVCLTILLLFMTIMTSRKGISLWRQESVDLKNPIQDKSVKVTSESTKATDPTDTPEENGDAETGNSHDFIDEKIRNIIEMEQKQYPVLPCLAIGFIWTSVIIFSLLKGGRRVESIAGIEKCSTQYWSLFFGFIVVSGLFCVTVGAALVSQTNMMEKAGYSWGHEDLKWSTRTVLYVQGMALVSGIASGLLGVGGGFILGPFMLSLGLNPQVSAATSSFMVLTTSTIAVLQFWIGELLIWDYALWVSGTAVFGAFAGVTFFRRITAKYQRTSPIVIVLATILWISTIVIPIQGVYLQIKKHEAGTAVWGFKGFC